MKKFVFVVVLLIGASAFSQQKEREEVPKIKKSEVYLNTFNLIAFKWFEVSYEHIINEESSIGVSGLVSLNDEKVFETSRNYSITPYYRHFFGNSYAQGFFMEVFSMFNAGHEDYYVYDYYESSHREYEEYEYTDLAFGIGIGGKFVSKRCFIGEIHTGIGRNLFNDEAPEIITRGGISFGYRF